MKEKPENFTNKSLGKCIRIQNIQMETGPQGGEGQYPPEKTVSPRNLPKLKNIQTKKFENETNYISMHTWHTYSRIKSYTLKN